MVADDNTKGQWSPTIAWEI